MRFGLGLGLGRGRGPSGAPSFVASAFAGRTFSARADVNFDVNGWADLYGNGVVFARGQTGFPTLAGDINGKPALTFVGAQQQCLGLAVGTGSVNTSALISAAEFTTFAVVNVTSVATNNASTHYENDSILAADSGAYTAPHFRSTPTAGVGNYDGNSDAAEVAIALGTACLITTWHKAGSIFVQKDGGTPVSVASGNSFVTTGKSYIGKSQARFYTGLLGEVHCYNVALADVDRDAANAALKLYYGIA